MKPIHTLSTALVIAASLLPAITAAQTVALNDTFSDGDRTNQSLPASSQWFFNHTTTASTLAVTGDKLRLNFNSTATGAAQAMTYFSPSGSPVTLADGGNLTVSFQFTMSEGRFDQNNLLRLGIYNSGGNRLTADSSSLNHAAFRGGLEANGGYKGYMQFLNPGTAAPGSASGIYRRDLNTSQNIAATSDYTLLGANANETTQFVMQAATPITVTYELTRIGDTLNIKSTMQLTPTTSWTVERLDSNPGSFAFDSFMLYTAQQSYSDADPTTAINYQGSITIDDFTVTSTAIPEPSSAAALAGGAALGLVALRRRHS